VATLVFPVTKSQGDTNTTHISKRGKKKQHKTTQNCHMGDPNRLHMHKDTTSQDVDDRRDDLHLLGNFFLLWEGRGNAGEG
jgi:hypothetical protein